MDGSLSLSCFLSPSLSHTHTCTYACIHAERHKVERNVRKTREGIRENEGNLSKIAPTRIHNSHPLTNLFIVPVFQNAGLSFKQGEN